MKKRITSIDTFRGISIFWMLLGHTLCWWLTLEDFMILSTYFPLIDALGASAFVFLSGISTVFSYKKKMVLNDSLNELEKRKIRTKYYLRALILLVIGFAFNFINSLLNPGFPIWVWTVLITIALALLLTWPLLKLSKWKRLLIGIVVILIDQFFFNAFQVYSTNNYLNNVMTQVFYGYVGSGVKTTPFVTFFPFFIIGTVFGELIYHMEEKDINKSLQDRYFVKRFFFVSALTGGSLILLGTLFFFPDVMFRNTFSWTIYTIGVEILLLTTFLIIEKYEIITINPKYRFLSYFSYYSLTLYLTNSVVSIFFQQQLNLVNYWLYFSLTIAVIFIIIKILHHKFNGKCSVKYVISFLSDEISDYIYERDEEKQPESVEIFIQKP